MERPLDQERANDDVKISPLELVSLFNRQFVEVSLCPFRDSYKAGNPGRKRFALKQALVEHVNRNKAERESDAALHEVDRVKVNQVRVQSNAKFESTVTGAILHHPAENACNGDGCCVDAVAPTVDDEIGDNVHADTGQKQADSSPKFKPTRRKCHHAHGKGHCDGWDVEQVVGPLHRLRHEVQPRSGESYRED